MFLCIAKSEEVVEEEQKPGLDEMEKAQQAAEGPEGMKEKHTPNSIHSKYDSVQIFIQVLEPLNIFSYMVLLRVLAVNPNCIYFDNSYHYQIHRPFDKCIIVKKSKLVLFL